MSKPAFNRLLGNKNITLFCKYGFKDTTPSDNTDNTEFNTRYKNVYLTTYFENVAFSDTNIAQPQNATLGSWSLLIDTTRKVSKVYRLINGVKYNLVYISELEYNAKTYEEQLTRYYTLSKDLKFADKIIPLDYEIGEEALFAKPDVFTQANSKQFDIDRITADRITILVTGGILTGGISTSGVK